MPDYGSVADHPYRAPGIAPLTGSHRGWAQQLADLTLEEGMSGYLLPVRDDHSIRRFALEVIPDVRERVAAERRRSTQP